MKSLEELLDSFLLLPEWAGVGAINMSTRNAVGDFPIHVAAMIGDESDIDLLLSSGAEINSAGEGGYTPLHCAVEFNRFGNVVRLLERGADPSAKNFSSQTPVDLAEIFDQKEMSKIIENFQRR